MEEVSVLIGKSQSGDKEAREVLIEKNLGLVHHIVKRFLGRGYDPEDLFQIGVIGLMKAIDKFDLKLEVRFSTYAVPMITGEIKRFLRDDGSVKGIPYHQGGWAEGQTGKTAFTEQTAQGAHLTRIVRGGTAGQRRCDSGHGGRSGGGIPL